MNDRFVDAQGMKKLTGRARKKCQIEQLRKQGIPFMVNALGEPIVLWSALEEQERCCSTRGLEAKRFSMKKRNNLPKGIRARPRGKKIFYYLDTGGKPRKEIPRGSDYVLAVQKWAELTYNPPQEKKY